MKMLLLILALLQPPTLTAVWQGNALHVTWQASGWHCLRLDGASLDCREGSADLLLKEHGIDDAYSPEAGQVLRLIDKRGVVVTSVAVPIHLTPRVNLPWVRSLPQRRVWLPWVKRG